MLLLIWFSLRVQGPAVGSDLNAGRGTIGRLIKDETMYKRVSESADNIPAIAQKTRSGERSLGMLVNDKTLYQDIRNVVDRARRTFELTEDQSVVRTFPGIVFESAR